MVCSLARLRESLNDFLKGANTKSEGDIPATIDDLQSSGIRLVISDEQDPDAVGFIQWRCAFYVAGDEGSLANFMPLFDQFVSFKAHQLAKDIEIHIHPHSSVEETVSEDALSGELEYKNYTFHDAAPKGLPLKIFECQPCIGKKVVSMDIQPVSGDVVSFLWSGQNWGFRAGLDSVDIKGAYFEDATEGTGASTGRTYYRTCQIDLVGEKGKIQQVITECFHHLAMRVRVRHAAEEGSAVAGLIVELRAIDCLHFADDK